jgi:hypothetical protein
MTALPPPLFHGTRRPFMKGGLLLPRAKLGGAPATSAPMKAGRAPNPDAENWVYVTTSLTLAWVYAWHAPGRGRPRVLTVTPLGPVYDDPEHSPDMEAYRTDAAVVAAVDLEPLVSEADARAGWVEA